MPANPPSQNSSFPFIADLLACPACRGKLRAEEAKLICESCGRVYPIVDGIPRLISDPEEKPAK